MAERTDFYVYVWHRGDTGVPVYVGKGRGDRWTHHVKTTVSNTHRNKRLAHTIKKHGGWCEFAWSGLSEKEAFFRERCLIADIGRNDLGRGSLFNYSNGGEGPAGYVWKPARVKEHIKRLEASAEHVITPVGRFRSCKHAAKAYGIKYNTALARARKQVKGWRYEKDQIDLVKANRPHHLSKPIVTPLGSFNTLELAGKAYGIGISSAHRWLHANWHGWHYEEVDCDVRECSI